MQPQRNVSMYTNEQHVLYRRVVTKALIYLGMLFCPSASLAGASKVRLRAKGLPLS